MAEAGQRGDAAADERGELTDEYLDRLQALAQTPAKFDDSTFHVPYGAWIGITRSVHSLIAEVRRLRGEVASSMVDVSVTPVESIRIIRQPK